MSEKKINANGRVYGKGVPKAGKRKPGGGAKKKFGEKTTTISKRVPESKKAEVDTMIDDVLQKWCI